MMIAPYQAFKNIGHDIDVAIKNGAYAGAVILTYAAINAMAFLSMPANKKEVHREDFIKWVEKYLKTDHTQPYQYRGIDLYGARCGIVHRYGARSRLSDNGQCKLFVYVYGSNHIYSPAKDEELVLISWNRLIQDFYEAMKKFLGDIIADTELKKRVDSRISGLFHTTPIE